MNNVILIVHYPVDQHTDQRDADCDSAATRGHISQDKDSDFRELQYEFPSLRQAKMAANRIKNIHRDINCEVMEP